MNSDIANTEDLMTLQLKIGLPVVRGGQTIHYKTVKLREVDVADERWAVRAAERLVLWDGQPKLVVSDPDYKLAMVCRHIDRFVCGDLYIETDLLTLDTIGKLKPVDLGLLEQRVFIIELALQLKYGEITEEQYTRIINGGQAPAAAPQPVGPAADAGDQPAASVPGPAMLADHSGQRAAGADQAVGA